MTEEKKETSYCAYGNDNFEICPIVIGYFNIDDIEIICSKCKKEVNAEYQ